MAVSRGTALPYPEPPGLKSDDAPTPAPTPAPTTNPVTVTAAELAAEAGIDTDRAARILRVASQTVTDYAPLAPTVMLNEAVYRYGGYLGQSDYGETRTETLGPLSIEHVVNHAAAFRNSGAAALLTRYKVRRAGAIG